MGARSRRRKLRTLKLARDRDQSGQVRGGSSAISARQGNGNSNGNGNNGNGNNGNGNNGNENNGNGNNGNGNNGNGNNGNGNDNSDDVPGLGKGEGKGKGGNAASSSSTAESSPSSTPAAQPPAAQPPAATTSNDAPVPDTTTSTLPETSEAPAPIKSKSDIQTSSSSKPKTSVVPIEPTGTTTQISIVTASGDASGATTQNQINLPTISATEVSEDSTIASTATATVTSSSSVPLVPSSTTKNGLSSGQIAGIVLGCLGFIFLVAIAVFLILRRRRRGPNQSSRPRTLFGRLVGRQALRSKRISEVPEAEKWFLAQDPPPPTSSDHHPPTATTTTQERKASAAAAAGLFIGLSQFRDQQQLDPHAPARVNHHNYYGQEATATTITRTSRSISISSSSVASFDATSSILSLPTTFRPGSSNSNSSAAFLMTTPLHHPPMPPTARLSGSGAA
ncbi:hypothetical protein P885DRAFT_74100 [Corynascus similis CBS 632.67]